jgi:hypothetical protein
MTDAQKAAQAIVADGAPPPRARWMSQVRCPALDCFVGPDGYPHQFEVEPNPPSGNEDDPEND